MSCSEGAGADEWQTAVELIFLTKWKFTLNAIGLNGNLANSNWHVSRWISMLGQGFNRSSLKV
jgi:hypothetical protein